MGPPIVAQRGGGGIMGKGAPKGGKGVPPSHGGCGGISGRGGKGGKASSVVRPGAHGASGARGAASQASAHSMPVLKVQPPTVGFGGAASPQAVGLAGLEKEAILVYQQILDLSVPTASVGAVIERALALRTQLISRNGKGGGVRAPLNRHQEALYAIGNGVGAPGAGGGAEADSFDYKSLLVHLAWRRAKLPPTKGELQFDAQPDPSGSGFNGSVSSAALLTKDHFSPGPATSKKLAERLAAKAALEAEFPEEYLAAMAEAEAQPPTGQGVKRKATPGTVVRPIAGSDAVAHKMDQKNRLIQATQLLLGRNVEKDDIVYDHQDLDGGMQCSVCLVNYDPATKWWGEICPTIKEAQMSAAEIAMSDLEPLLGPIREEHKAKKARIAREKKNASARGAKEVKEENFLG